MKKRKIIVLAIILFLVVTVSSFLFTPLGGETTVSCMGIDAGTTSAPKDILVPQVHNASILSAGDIILHSPFLSSRIYHNANGTYDFTSMFRYIKEDYQNADFTVVNLESTISESNYCGYPTFRAPAAIAEAISQSQADLCLLANNHIYDNGDYGLHTTMDSVAEHSLLYAGTRKTTSDNTYFIQEINGIKVGIFNYVYASGDGVSQKAINGLPVNAKSAPLINTFSYANLEVFYEEIQTGLSEMKEQGTEYTIAYLHWGNEYQLEENALQRKIASRLCELGVDALIGGHPHVVQPVDLLTNSEGNHQMVCIYSMGNHISNQRKELLDSMPTGHTEDGLMVNLTLTKVGNGAVALTDVELIPTWVYKTLKNGGAEYYVLPLDDPESILQEASELNISADIEKSIQRTKRIIENGEKKIQAALPIINID